MRKLIFSALLVTGFVTGYAQKLDEVKEKINKGKYDEAWDKLEKVLADPKNQQNANAWYYKGIIFNNMAADSTKTDKNYRQEALDAFKRYHDLDPKNVMGTLEQNARVFQIYEGYYNDAIKAYNANNFESSFNNFRNALATEEFIRGKNLVYPGISFPALDTGLILNIAAAATKAKLEDSAMAYYSRLADAKVKGENYIEIYQVLIDYYDRKKDDANKAKYIAIGRELYPDSDYWYDAELSGIREDKPKLFTKYQELTKANPDNYFLTYNYAVEMFNYLYAGDKKPDDAATYEAQVEDVINSSIKAKNTPDANLLMVRYLSEKIYKLEDQGRTIKGTTPDAVKKRQANTAEVQKVWDKLVPYAEAAFNGYAEKQELKGYEKGNLKFISNVLIDYYNMKKQMDKVKMYEEKTKALGV